MKTRLQYVYGPVPSWRMGSSLRIDLLSQKGKICSYDCLYCQLGKTQEPGITRRKYVGEDAMLRELEMLPDDLTFDYITFSGRGEPTLTSNLGSAIIDVRTLRPEPIAVITNSSLMGKEDVREELSRADFIIAKLDASSKTSFDLINRPFHGLRFDDVVEGIKEFRKHFRGKFALQIMFIQLNAHLAGNIAQLAREINPDEVQINTPLRPCGAEALKKEALSEIKELFSGTNAISVYESQKKIVTPISNEDTLRRRGKTLQKEENV